jgi:hypothetical protein
VTKALELHGDFFQQRCVQEIERAGWKLVDTELPIHVADDSSAADIWAEGRGAGFDLQAIIECKRSHPDFRVWVFLSRASSGKIEFPVVYQEPGSTISSAKRELLIFSDIRGPKVPITHRYAQHGREVAPDATDKRLREDFEQMNRPRGRRPQGERIAHGCYQLALGVRSVVRDEVQILHHRMWRVWQPLTAPRFYLPILVTTAHLLYGSVAGNAVSLTDGHVGPEGVTYEKVDWLIYGYPLPETLQLFPMDGLGNQYRYGQYRYTALPGVPTREDYKLQHLDSAGGATRYKRLPILIVRGTALGDCLKTLMQWGWSGVI